jgi:hypothetical protein
MRDAAKSEFRRRFITQAAAADIDIFITFYLPDIYFETTIRHFRT